MRDRALIREELAFIGTCDVCGQVRGKGVPAAELADRPHRGVGWTPTNVMINAFGIIGQTPFGALGDVMMVPDHSAEIRVDYEDGGPIEHLVLADIREADGSPWSCCPREFLRRALARLEKLGGLQLLAGFEQEFVYTGVEAQGGNRYWIDAFRRQGSFGEAYVVRHRHRHLFVMKLGHDHSARRGHFRIEPVRERLAGPNGEQENGAGEREEQ